ncbi:hypothetical protein GCK72_001300 [Caenorhabditis remanei]|uniref:RNA (guanine-9-)-methyltransferase domain-containing protein 1 n=1 Tax=Caenorhabditis remanei TaxID=31234 RepID=A0A6A5HTB8_CAERE|nr:hypothetical protein GCK72_001300 [Caenorhabditis remanei]KAF1769483.1 hypothetical protein GCK72_001300 [Caenorhabditis remanei]
MEVLANAVQKLQWEIRSLLRISQKTVAPVLWYPSAMTSMHEPSPEFLSKLTSEENKKVEMILKEFDLFSRLSKRFPSKLKDSDWKTLLEVSTRKARYEQAMFLYRKEILEAEDMKKKGKLREGRTLEAANQIRNPTFISPYLQTKTQEWSQFRNVVEAYRLENQPILAVDCQFLNRLSPRGRGLTALQLQYLISENRNSQNPFRLHFVNYNKKDPKIRELEKNKLQSLANPDVFCPIISNDGFKNVFEAEIIYLSPDAPEELESVENNKVYVIGGIVDRVVEHGIPKMASLEAAQSANVLARKLPIDRYVDFKSGSKFLTLLAVSEILRQVNLHGDWSKAMEVAIPKRNIRAAEEKNQNARAAQARIHEFNAEVLRRVEKRLGKDVVQK